MLLLGDIDSGSVLGEAKRFLYNCTLRVRSESTFTGEYSPRVVNSPPNGRSDSRER